MVVIAFNKEKMSNGWKKKFLLHVFLLWIEKGTVFKVKFFVTKVYIRDDTEEIGGRTKLGHLEIISRQKKERKEILI